MRIIRAQVNRRLLAKAARLFTGTLDGRIIEVLQNARRAGAAQVEITNREDGYVIVRDDGQGIEDFSKLLDLGGSGWDDGLEASEDPAGVGLFCLAPRALIVRSNGYIATIDGGGWTGGVVSVDVDPEPVAGTMLSFQDEPWSSDTVERHAVFSGLRVTVDGTACPSEPFVSDSAVAHSELGCRIEVRKSEELSPWHRGSGRGRYYCDNILVNFHGQIVSLRFDGVHEPDLHFLVDLTGEPTGIRLMLPARTQLIENEALAALKAAIELEGFRYLQRRGYHRLPYKQYQRAQELGIALPEAKPTYRVGLLAGDSPEPIAVQMPENFPLASCFRFDSECPNGAESDEANAHLLAALGEFETPFVPVEIRREYDGYSWAKLPTIQHVKLTSGKTLHESDIWLGKLTCVDAVSITVHTSDGALWESAVCMAIPTIESSEDRWEDRALITPQAQERLRPTDIWHHLGGWSDEGDTYDTQECDFSEQLERFWDQLVGPDEHLRRRMFEAVGALVQWERITLTPDGRMVIQLPDGAERIMTPPERMTLPEDRTDTD